MSTTHDDKRIDLRLDLARGHWELGEEDDTVGCLERAFAEVGDDPRLTQLIGEIEGRASPEAAKRLRVLREVVESYEGGAPEEVELDFAPDPGPDPEAGFEPGDMEKAMGGPVGLELELDESDEPVPTLAEVVHSETGSSGGGSSDGDSSDRDSSDPLVDDEPTDPPARFATSTLAELYAAQGLPKRALDAAEDVLRRNPGDERARALRDRMLAGQSEGDDSDDLARAHARVIEELERWLRNVERLREKQEASR